LHYALQFVILKPRKITVWS